VLATIALSILLALSFDAPPAFVPEKPQSAMQFARYRIAAGEAGGEDALVVVYYFGKGQGGSADDNVKRWLGQYSDKEGDPKVEKAKTKSGLDATIVDVTGTEFAPTPINPNAAHRPGWRLIGAIVEAPDGNYFVKATGPKALIEKNAAAIRGFIDSAKP
jgi:hypothetical protein